MDDVTAELAKIAEELAKIAESLDFIMNEGIKVAIYEMPIVRTVKDEMAERRLRKSWY